MKIIGHRGVSGLALENTIPSIELARLLGVDAIEVDVRKTKDNQLVLAHDDDLFRVSGKHIKVSESTLEELGSVTLNDGQSKVPTLKQAFEAAEKTRLIIEVKVVGCADLLLNLFDELGIDDVAVASFKHDEAELIKSMRPSLTVYLAEHTRAFDIIDRAREAKVDGLDLNFWLLNPLTYFLARRRNLQIMVYSVNSRIIARFIHLLYPKVAICTDHPEWFITHPWLKLRSYNRDTEGTGTKHTIKKTSKTKKRSGR